MSDSFPERPDPDQLGRRTEERREVSALLTASVDGRWRQATEILAANPGIAERDLRAATVLGDVDAVRSVLAAEPSAAVAIDDDRGWSPLLYASYSRWHEMEPHRAAAIAEAARLLIEAGASPNTNDGGRLRYRSALKGSVEVNNPGLTEVLLEAGANPDPGEPIVEAVGRGDQRCLALLITHGARVSRTWALGAAVFRDDAAATSLLLDALSGTGGGAAEPASGVLPEAAAAASASVVAALLDAGADPDAADDGVSALRLAVRAGRDDTAALLRRRGAIDDITAVDRFVGACFRGDRRGAERVLADEPGVRDRMTDEDRCLIVEAAGSRHPEAVALMLELGFPIDARRFGEEALHNAAYWGKASIVRLLLERGADVDARDERFDGTPLAFATVGSGEQEGTPGEWTETVRLLLEAGARRDDAWVTEKPPSEEVGDLLRRYGIAPEDAASDQRPSDGLALDELASDELASDGPGRLRHDDTAASRSVGTGVMGEVAEHLEAAYRHRDLDLLGSLLHPEVQWSGVCTDKGQVLDWYRKLEAEDTVADVDSVEVDGDAVVLGLAVSRRAEGARPVPPQHLYQVFTVDDAQIVDIRAYPTRDAALARGPRAATAVDDGPP
jgi:ankyrin repeat protein